MTSFAVQTTRDKVIEKSKRAVEPSGGLHAALRKKGSQKIEWADIGASTVAKIGRDSELHSPVALRLLWAMAGGEDQPEREKRSGYMRGSTAALDGGSLLRAFSPYRFDRVEVSCRSDACVPDIDAEIADSRCKCDALQ
ncbi:hypothetical protein BKA70DRAFT_1234943 [Coprinopsis sp. MPI-PUGE-AT-0042]|nr:hypothetical protein BKA70DRAFT_1234943 [Coprinopsis sp. MPI-PUGE-AT-0042]